MALRNIVTVGDSVLSKTCRPVTKFDKRLHTLLAQAEWEDGACAASQPSIRHSRSASSAPRR